MEKVKISMRTRETLTGYGFIGFWLIGFLVLTLYPLIQSFWLSFNEASFYEGKIKTSFILFQNFKYAFLNDTMFPMILKDYLSDIIINVPFVIIVALFIAMLLNRKIRFRGMWRVIFFLPVVITSGPIITELMDQGATSIPMLSDGTLTGFIENYLPSFIATPILVLFKKIILMLWFSGVPILIFLASLQRIDKSVYEASSIDGASSWQNFWKISLPSVKGFMFVNVVYTIVTLSFFDLPRQTSGRPTILTFMKTQAYGVNTRGFGYACAIGIIFLLLIVLQIGFYALILLREKKTKKVVWK